MHGAGTCLVSAGSVDEVFGLYDALALRHHVEVIVRGVVLRRAIAAIAIAAQLAYGLHAGGTAVKHLNEVEVTLAVDGDAYLDAVADLK